MATTMSSAPQLPVPSPPRAPAPGCDVCASLAAQRSHATATGDHSRASDCTVQIQRHPQHAPIPEPRTS